jgi:hypothetical protein
MIGKNSQALSSNNPACRCGCLPRGLHIRANAHLTADDGAADAYRVACYAYRLTANCHTNRCAADARQHGYRRATGGNLAIFYRDFGYPSGLVVLGKIDGDAEALEVPGPIEATIELLK